VIVGKGYLGARGNFCVQTFPLALPFKKLLENILDKFLAVLFCPNGIVFLMGPLPPKK
jgi:hypothetical protein